MMQSISIIMLSNHQREILTSTLDRLLHHVEEMESPVQVIVVTPHESPLTISKVEHHVPPALALNNFGALRNFGISKTNGEVIVFLDDDCWPAQDWLINLVAPIERNQSDAVGGGILFQETNGIGRAIALLGFPAGGLARMIAAKNEMVRTSHISTGNCAFRKSLLKDPLVHGFNEELKSGGEDQDFFDRISQKYRTHFVPSAIVFHRQRESLLDVVRWFIRRGRAEAQRLAVKKSEFSLIKMAFCPIRSSFSFKFFLWLMLLMIAKNYWPWILAGSFVIYGLFLVFRVLVRHRWQGFEPKCDLIEARDKMMSWTVLLVAPVVKLTMDVGFEIGKIQEAIKIWKRDRNV